MKDILSETIDWSLPDEELAKKAEEAYAKFRESWEYAVMVKEGAVTKVKFFKKDNEHDPKI